MIINILEENNNCELIFSIELPNSRAKRYIKKAIKNIEPEDIEPEDFEELLELTLIDHFEEEWIEEAQKRLNYNFIDLYSIRNFQAKGKGHPIYFECVSAFAKAIQEENYKGFELELKTPVIDKESDLEDRIEEAFYKLVKHRKVDEKVKVLNKIKADLEVFDKVSGDKIEDLSEKNFFDYVDELFFPKVVLAEIEKYQAGDCFEVEVDMDNIPSPLPASGVVLIFKVTIHEVYREVLPEAPYTDELARKIGYKSLQDLENHAKEQQKLYEENLYRDELAKSYLFTVAERMGIEPTENMIFNKREELEFLDRDGEILPETKFFASYENIKKDLLTELITEQIVNAAGLEINEEAIYRELSQTVPENWDENEVAKYAMRLMLEKKNEWLCENIPKWISLKVDGVPIKEI